MRIRRRRMAQGWIGALVVFDASERDGFVLVRSVRAVQEGLWLVCEVAGRRIGIPTHAIAAWSDVRQSGDYGVLALQRQVAESMGLVPATYRA